MADTVNLQKNFSVLNEKLIKLFDESGVKRSFTVPYINGQEMHEHITAVGQAATQVGGLTKNLITTAHRSGGKGWGNGDGHTVGHPADKLKSTIIPKDDERAKAAIAAAQKSLNDIEFLLGKDSAEVKTAKSQLAIVKKTDGAGMNLLDFGVMLIQLMYRPTQAVARAHDQTKPGGMHPKLRPPVDESQAAPQGGAQPQEGAPEPSAAPPAPAAAPAAPAASTAASVAPAGSQAQG